MVLLPHNDHGRVGAAAQPNNAQGEMPPAPDLAFAADRDTDARRGEVAAVQARVTFGLLDCAAGLAIVRG